MRRALPLEIVVPLRRRDGTVGGVLDVDSTHSAWFDEEDARGLEPLAALVLEKCGPDREPLGT